MSKFNGLSMSLGNLSRLSDAKTRSISAENVKGGKGKGGMSEPKPDGPARELGVGWKCRPWYDIEPNEIFTVAEIEGSGAIQSIWCAGATIDRDLILRIYWDDQEIPSVECPLPDFFGSHWVTLDMHKPEDHYVHINSLPVSVNPRNAYNCFWEMPFRKKCRITLENLNPTKSVMFFYQVNYTLTDIEDDIAYFHAQFRRVNPQPYKEPYTILDGVTGKGHYVGTSMGWGVNACGWWGEGEIKFFLDGDGEFPTICGTGVEDYFGGAWGFKINKQYTTYTGPYLGMHEVIQPSGANNSQLRHGLYRWHIMDPIRFEKDIKVTIQDLAWRSEVRYRPGQSDLCSVAYWYQTLPTQKFPKLPSRDELEVR
jgi:hypothetical protein